MPFRLPFSIKQHFKVCESFLSQEKTVEGRMERGSVRRSKHDDIPRRMCEGLQREVKHLKASKLTSRRSESSRTVVCEERFNGG